MREDEEEDHLKGRHPTSLLTADLKAVGGSAEGMNSESKSAVEPGDSLRRG